MALSQFSTEILLLIFSPTELSYWPVDVDVRRNLRSWRLVCRLWNDILKRYVRANICTLDALIKFAPEDKVLHEMSFMNPKVDKDPTIDDLFYEANDYYIPRDLPYYAAVRGYDRVMREMQNWGMDLNPYFDDGEESWLEGHTMLGGAALGGSVAAMRMVLDAGGVMKHEIDNREGVALCAAVGQGHENIVQLLLEEAAAVHRAGTRGRGYYFETLKAALVEAARLGEDGILRVLLAEVTNPDDDGDKGEGYFITIEVLKETLRVAMMCRREGIARYLMDKYAVLANDKHNLTELLSEAAGDGSTSSVEFLLDKGASMDTTSDAMVPVMHAAVMSGNEKMVSLLLERGSDVNQRDVYYHTTPLIKAMALGNFAIVKMLLDKGADILVEDRTKNTALKLAARYSHKSIVQLLLERMAGLEKLHPFQDDVFMEAVKGGDSQIVELLVKNGMNISKELVKNAIGEASRSGRNNILRYFFDTGTNIRECGYALYNAVAEGHAYTVTFLLENGADVHYKSPRGESLLNIFTYGHPTKIVEELLDAGITVTEDDMRNPGVRSVLRKRGWKEKRRDGILHKPG